MSINNKEKHTDKFYIWFNDEAKEEYYVTGLFLCLTKRKYEENNSIRLTLTDSIKLKEETDIILKHPSFRNSPYVDRIGTMLIMLLNADFKTFEDAYDTFFYAYGFDALNGYIANYEDITKFDSFEDFKLYYKKLFKTVKSQLVKLQKDFKETVDIVYNLSENNTYSEYKPSSRLIGLLIKNETNIHSYTNHINIEYEKYSDKKQEYANMNLDNLIKQIDDETFIKVNTIYSSNYLGDICYAVLNKLTSIDTSIIKKCSRCGRYFIPTVRNDEIYCDIPNIDGSRTCREKGAKETYKKNLENVPGLLEYRRTYQKKLMYCSRNKEDKQAKKDFDKWRKDAQGKIKEYKNGILSDNQLYDWMIENR